MSEEAILLILLPFVLAWLVYRWLKEARFYRENRWDMRKDPPDRIVTFYDGDMVGKASNQKVLIFHYPFFIGMCVLFMMVLAAKVFGF